MKKKLKLEPKKGLLLDIGCGSNKQKGFTGMDKRKVKGVDVVHDLEDFPFPFEDNECHTIIGSHIIEHIKPWLMIDLMNELWRICKVEGKLAFVLPYGWSYGFIQDPTHCNPCNEATWQYFDPGYFLWSIYKPKPWSIEMNTWQVTGNMEVVLRKITEKEGSKIYKREIANRKKAEKRMVLVKRALKKMDDIEKVKLRVKTDVIRYSPQFLERETKEEKAKLVELSRSTKR